MLKLSDASLDIPKLNNFFLRLPLLPSVAVSSSVSLGNMMFTLETILGPLWVSVAGIEKISYLNIIGIVLVVLFLLFNGIMTIRYS